MVGYALEQVGALHLPKTVANFGGRHARTGQLLKIIWGKKESSEKPLSEEIVRARG